VLELQGLVVAKLKADATVGNFVADRIYDDVPPAPTFPYLSIGSAFELNDDADCLAGSEISIRIDAWARSPSAGPTVYRLAEAVKNAIHSKYDSPLPTNALALLEWRRTDFLRDPDGLTRHAAIEFVASIEQP
jgi:hypothetical protein